MRPPKIKDVDTRNPVAIAWACEARARYHRDTPSGDEHDRAFSLGRADALEYVAIDLLGISSAASGQQIREALRGHGIPPWNDPEAPSC